MIMTMVVLLGINLDTLKLIIKTNISVQIGIALIGILHMLPVKQPMNMNLDTVINGSVDHQTLKLKKN